MKDMSLLYKLLMKSGISTACTKIGEKIAKIFIGLFLGWSLVSVIATFTTRNMGFLIAPIVVLVSYITVMSAFEQACAEADREASQ